MKNKFITIPIVPIIIFSIIILIVIIGKNVGKKEDEKIDEIVSQNILFEVSNAIARAGEEITINIKMKKDVTIIRPCRGCKK